MFDTQANEAEFLRNRPAYPGYKRALAATAKKHNAKTLALTISISTQWAALDDMQEKAEEQGESVIYGQAHDTDRNAPYLRVYYYDANESDEKQQAIGDELTAALAAEGVEYIWDGDGGTSIQVLL